MRISNLTLGIVDTNTYFIENEENVILIDPSSESQKIIKKLNQINNQDHYKIKKLRCKRNYMS